MIAAATEPGQWIRILPRTRPRRHCTALNTTPPPCDFSTGWLVLRKTSSLWRSRWTASAADQKTTVFAHPAPAASGS